VLDGHPRTPWCIAFHPANGDILASGCLAGEVRIWDLKVITLLRRLFTIYAGYLNLTVLFSRYFLITQSVLFSVSYRIISKVKVAGIRNRAVCAG